MEQSRDPATGISADFSASNAHAVYMSEIRRLKAAGIKDMEAASAIVRDRRTIARIRARELMDHIVTHKLHLKELFWEYDPMHKGIIPLSDFLTILKDMDLHWAKEDYTCVAELFGSEVGSDDDGMVRLSSITRFGKTAKDSIILTWLILLEIMYPTLVRSAVMQMACRSGKQWW